MKKCRNCESPQLYDAEFCHVCGQKYTTSKFPIWNLFSEFFDAVFSLESRSLRTLGGLFIPAGLTVDFFSGKQIRYVPPLRIFLFAAGIFLAVFGYRVNEAISSKADKMSNSLHEFFIKQQVLNKMDSVYSDFNVRYQDSFPTRFGDSLIAEIQNNIFDTIDLDVAFTIDDSLGNKINIPAQELADGDVDRLIKKYNATDWWSKSLIAQMVRFTKSPNAFIQKILGSLIWMILVLMPVIALVLKLLYWRRKRYFMEHLVFTFHFHSFALFLMAFILWFFTNDMVYIGLTLLLTIVYLFIAMKNYYKQSFGKTFVKWSLLLWCYFFITLLFLTITLGTSFITF